MKGALLLIGVLVCISMTEASSVRLAKKPFKAFQSRQVKTTRAQVFNVGVNTGCGDTCDTDLAFAVGACMQYCEQDEETCLVTCCSQMFDSDCHDCLCDW